MKQTRISPSVFRDLVCKGRNEMRPVNFVLLLTVLCLEYSSISMAAVEKGSDHGAVGAVVLGQNTIHNGNKNVRTWRSGAKFHLTTTDRASCPSPANYICCNNRGCILLNSSGTQIASVAAPCAIVKSTSVSNYNCIGKYGCTCSASAVCPGGSVSPYNCFNAYP